jgi:hypothetical protein
MKKLMMLVAATVTCSLAVAASALAVPPTPTTGCGVGFAVSNTMNDGLGGLGVQARALGVNPGDAIKVVHDYNKTLC